MEQLDQHIIDLKKISFGYAGCGPVLDELSFSLNRGERIGLIGDNGGGKTTFLHIIVGLLKVTAGEIKIFNQSAESESDFVKIRQKVGLLFQNSDDQLFFPTVLEDVAFGPLNLGKTAKEARDIARATLQELKLEGYENRITHRLSGGEKKLVALATILAMKPEILLLDEPSNGLDQLTKNRLSEVLQRLQASCIIVSHEFEFLYHNTDNVFGIREGKIEYQGESSVLHSHFHSHPAGEIPHKHQPT